jgi:hypothetical protein
VFIIIIKCVHTCMLTRPAAQPPKQQSPSTHSLTHSQTPPTSPNPLTHSSYIANAVTGPQWCASKSPSPNRSGWQTAFPPPAAAAAAMGAAAPLPPLPLMVVEGGGAAMGMGGEREREPLTASLEGRRLGP